MAQNRPPPAFQEYADHWIANRDWKLASLEARGLLWTMRLECWANHSVPSDPATLARLLGFTSEEVRRASPAVMPFFKVMGDEIICPELEDYRAHLEAARTKQSNGGKKSAANKKSVGKSLESDATQGVSRASSSLKEPCKVASSNLQVPSSVKTSSVQSKPTQPPKRSSALVDDPFVSAYEQTETSYSKASNGY